MFYTLTYPLFWGFFRALLGVLGRLKITGREKVPRTGGVIYCPNHFSDSDPIAVFVSFPRRAWFIGKSELFERGFMALFFRNFHAFPIKRDSADRVALRRAEDCLKRGEPILLFPEGRVSVDGRLQEMQPGAAFLSVRTGAPIVPIGLVGTTDLLPYGDVVLRYTRRQVTVTFGDPIDPKEYADVKHGPAIEAITKRLGDALAQLTGRVGGD